MSRNDFLFSQNTAIIRQDDLCDPSIKREDTNPAGVGQHKLRPVGKFVRNPWNVSGVVARLYQLAKEKLNARQIALRLNHEFSLELTRASVIGRMCREGINPGRKGLKPKAPKIVVRAKPVLRVVSNVAPKPKLTEPAARGDVSDGCRFLHGEAELRNFCGARSSGPWCEYHHQIVYVKGK